MESSDDVIDVTMVYEYMKRRQKRKIRKFWVHPCNLININRSCAITA